MSRLLFINTSLGQGGSERVMALLASGLADAGEDVTMLLVREGKNNSYPVSKQLKVKQLHYSSKNKVSVLFQRFIQTRRIIRSEKPDAVVSFMWDINAFTLLCCMFLPVRVIVSERADPGSASVRRFSRHFTERFLYRLADQIVLQTEYVKRYYPEAIQKKCVVIPNPVSSDLPQPYYGERRKEIVAAGRMTEQKNFKMLISAFRDFYAKHDDWTLAIYGEGPMRQQLEEFTRSLKIESAVQFPGFVSDLPQRICEAGIYVSSSNFEGISNVMLEALAMGIPSICTDCPVGGAALAIQDGENGLLIPVGDETALKRALFRLAEDPDLALQFGRTAPTVRQKYSIERICESWKTACGLRGRN